MKTYLGLFGEIFMKHRWVNSSPGQCILQTEIKYMWQVRERKNKYSVDYHSKLERRSLKVTVVWTGKTHKVLPLCAIWNVSHWYNSTVLENTIVFMNSYMASQLNRRLTGQPNTDHYMDMNFESKITVSHFFIKFIRFKGRDRVKHVELFSTVTAGFLKHSVNQWEISEKLILIL